MDVRLPQGFWGSIEHNVRDVAENYFKVYVLQIKSAHTSEAHLARKFTKWWQSYQTAYPELAAREIPTEAAELLNTRSIRSKGHHFQVMRVAFSETQAAWFLIHRLLKP